MSPSPNWLNLPIKIWAAISRNHFTSISEYLSFRGVCRSWRLIASFDNFDSATPRVPWLMFVSGEKEKEKKDIKKSANLFDVSTNKAIKMNNFYPTDGKRYLSCGGWILCVSNGSGDVCLAHPVWRARIELPGEKTFPDDDGDIVKMVLSGSPTSKTDDFVVMVIWGKNRQLGFSMPGDKSWTVMDTWAGWFCDIIYHNGKLYAVDSSKRVVECDIHGPSPTRIRQVFSLPSSATAAAGVDRGLFFYENMYYLVESCGKFLIVIRHSSHRTTFWFEVFEFDLKDGSHKQIKQFDKWNKAMFLGLNSSVCIELSNWDVVYPHCIYLTDDSNDKVVIPDVGVYSLISMKPTKGLHVPPLGDAFLTPPTWVMPSF